MMGRSAGLWAGAVAALGLWVGVDARAAEPGDPAAVERGGYLFAAAGCAGCHTDVKGKGPLLGGGRPLATPFGVFYSPNISADPIHGIGRWTDADFIRALGQGVRPDGAHYFPAFPYPAYTRMTERDMLDIKAYIFTLPPAPTRNRRHELRFPFNVRALVGVWKFLNFEPGPLAPDPSRDGAWNRGAYLVEALGHCGECHTPRDVLGGPRRDMALAGNPDGPEGGVVPNVTPDPDTGIGKWRAGDLDSFFSDGLLPDGDFAGGAMAEVIENTTSKWMPGDRAAVIAHLRTLPPIRNKVERKRK